MDILRQCKFGIEIETCVCFTANPSVVYDDEDDALRLFVEISNQLTTEKFNYLENENDPEIDYSRWNVVNDYSVMCNVGTHEPEFGYYSPTKIPKCEFYGIEIVSPILSYPNGLNVLLDVHNNVLMSGNFVYEVNESQGLHISVSNPLMDARKLLALWAYFESVILSFVPVSRRKSQYTKSIRDITATHLNVKDVESLYDWYQKDKSSKYTSLNIKKNGEIAEFRIMPGTVIFEDIVQWCDFLCKFVTASIVHNSRDFPALKHGTFEELFTLYINDKDLSRFFHTIMWKNAVFAEEEV